jgi:hypothetical protein
MVIKDVPTVFRMLQWSAPYEETSTVGTQKQLSRPYPSLLGISRELFLDAVRETSTALINEILDKEVNLGLEAGATVETNAAPYEANLEAGMATLKTALKETTIAVDSSESLNKLNESQAALMVTESFLIPSAFPVYESSSKLFDTLDILNGGLIQEL